MNGQPHPTALSAAVEILPHLAQNLATAQLHTQRASLPDVEAIAGMINAAFWASLRREEGFTPTISLAFAEPGEVADSITFERPIPVLAQPLTQLAPAVERPGIHLAVCRGADDLWVWGATRVLPPLCFVLEVLAPGLLVVKQSSGEEAAKFVNIAVIEGENVKIVDQRAAMVPDCPALVSELLGLETHLGPTHAVSILIQLAISMRAHGRGGSLLVVPSSAETWRQSILSPIRYAVVPPFTRLADLMEVDPEERRKNRWQDALRRAVDQIAGLTAVDGATVLTSNHHLLAFGAKIIRRPGSHQIDRVIATEPIEGAVPLITEPGQLGGTRHLSAAQFAYDQRDAVALVASQDGRFTVFGWSPCENMVHAHRIETLLL